MCHTECRREVCKHNSQLFKNARYLGVRILSLKKSTICLAYIPYTRATSPRPSCSAACPLPYLAGSPQGYLPNMAGGQHQRRPSVSPAQAPQLDARTCALMTLVQQNNVQFAPRQAAESQGTGVGSLIPSASEDAAPSAIYGRVAYWRQYIPLI